MKLEVGLHLRGEKQPRWELPEAPYIPSVGETFSYKNVAKEDIGNPGIRPIFFRVLSRKVQYVRVGGSEPYGLDDYCYIALTVEQIEEESLSAPSTETVQ